MLLTWWWLLGGSTSFMSGGGLGVGFGGISHGYDGGSGRGSDGGSGRGSDGGLGGGSGGGLGIAFGGDSIGGSDGGLAGGSSGGLGGGFGDGPGDNGSNDRLGDSSRDSWDYNSDDSSDDNIDDGSSAVANNVPPGCCFCYPTLIHPPCGYDIGIFQHLIEACPMAPIVSEPWTLKRDNEQNRPWRLNLMKEEEKLLEQRWIQEDRVYEIAMELDFQKRKRASIAMAHRITESGGFSREKGYAKKKRKRDGRRDKLTDAERGVIAWNNQQLKSGGCQYELVRHLRIEDCLDLRKKLLISHANFEAKPISSPDDQIKLFFVEVKREGRKGVPHVTLCCPVERTASSGDRCGGSGDGSGGGSVGSSACVAGDGSGDGLGGGSVGGSGDGTSGGSAGGSGDGNSGGSGVDSEDDGSDSGSDDSFGDISNETSEKRTSDASCAVANDRARQCLFCLPELIHPPQGFDIGIFQNYIAVHPQDPFFSEHAKRN